MKANYCSHLRQVNNDILNEKLNGDQTTRDDTMFRIFPPKFEVFLKFEVPPRHAGSASPVPALSVPASWTCEADATRTRFPSPRQRRGR